MISGPPKYFTYNWYQADKSVNALADLSPEIVATGHGKLMEGREMRQQTWPSILLIALCRATAGM
ncbi:hypothetical protein GCM10007423_26410 [Dyadobacter endophyticus]|uniref:Metallo-beta-lactamase superfamily protein n=1 Tax=Dyadobacter endophyticus TaxID=1749036 RepID=A0ABQ1YRP0_9BACT|nr:hypothetical protein [Dyadobacter endophyticus]GGH35055.1 hypothetical protein GCM10007423_26410 [Dyadobacter endophyticus]